MAQWQVFSRHVIPAPHTSRLVQWPPAATTATEQTRFRVALRLNNRQAQCWVENITAASEVQTYGGRSLGTTKKKQHWLFLSCEAVRHYVKRDALRQNELVWPITRNLILAIASATISRNPSKHGLLVLRASDVINNRVETRSEANWLEHTDSANLSRSDLTENIILSHPTGGVSDGCGYGTR